MLFTDQTEATNKPSLFHSFNENISINSTRPALNFNISQPDLEFDKDLISITTDASYNLKSEYDDSFIAAELEDDNDEKLIKATPSIKNITSVKPQIIKHPKKNSTSQFVFNVPKPSEHGDSKEELLNNLFGFIFKDEEITEGPKPNKSKTGTITTTTVAPTSTAVQTNVIPLKLLTILNTTKKESPDKVEPPQRKNNKIIDTITKPSSENPVVVTVAPIKAPGNINPPDNLTILRDVLLETLNNPSVDGSSMDAIQNTKTPPLPINQPFIDGHSNLNTNTVKHQFHTSPIRSDLDLIIPVLNSKTESKFTHNNINLENYQVLPVNVTGNIANTESYVVNPVDVEKLKQHHSEGETRIFTKPLKDPAGILKLAGCNIYGRMYRVGRIISELSGPCLECRCTEVGVSCTPLPC